MGRIEEAAQDLLEPEFGVDPSVALWRAAVLAEQGTWDEARQEFMLGAISFPDLTKEMRVRLQLIAADTAFQSGELAGAELELESIDPEEATPADISKGKLIIGRARLAMGDRVGALQILEGVIEEQYPPTWAEAQVAHTNARFGAGEIDAAEAIDRLERLLFVWRGGPFELSLLKEFKRPLSQEG